MKIATWNVNSIAARLPLVLEWVDATHPDIILFQELKCITEKFPFSPFGDKGYNIAVLGQKTYNGVAILSKFPLEDIQKGLPHEPSHQARYIEAFTGGVRVASLYAPNGQSIDSEAYQYKLAFYGHLKNHLRNNLRANETFIIGGDFNVAPRDIDVYDPLKWADEVLVSKPERLAFKAIEEIGFIDSYVHLYPDAVPPAYTWWDYRRGAWHRDHGLRIDHLLISKDSSRQLKEVGIDKAFRGMSRPSDHAPLWGIISKKLVS